MINSICQRNFALVCRNDKHILKFKSLYAMNGCNIDGDARGNVWNLSIILKIATKVFSRRIYAVIPLPREQWLFEIDLEEVSCFV